MTYTSEVMEQKLQAWEHESKSFSIAKRYASYAGALSRKKQISLKHLCRKLELVHGHKWNAVCTDTGDWVATNKRGRVVSVGKKYIVERAVKDHNYLLEDYKVFIVAQIHKLIK